MFVKVPECLNMIFDYRGCRTRHDSMSFFGGSYGFFLCSESIFRSVREIFKGVLEVL